MSGTEPSIKSPVIVMADDDPADRMLTQKAFKQADLTSQLHFVEDGAELMDFLKRRDKYAKPADAPRPDLILLDLNMPKMDGREFLAAVKEEAELHRIPVIVLTTSAEERDVVASYDLGANAYIVKPNDFESLVSVARVVKSHWLGAVRLPPN